MAWHVKATGAYSGSDAEDNANMIYSILSGKGWTKNAIAGLLGNIQAESGLNPWRWQGDNVQSTTNSPWKNHGYGLTQFTGAGKYINNASSYTGYGPNFSDKTGSQNDGTAQMLFLNDNADYYKTSAYPLTYSQYKTSTLSPSYLGAAWVKNYERPADQSSSVLQYRGQLAENWYTVIGGSSSDISHSITIEVVGNGTASASQSTGFAGDTITLTEQPADGETFVGWTVMEGSITIENSRFTMGSEDVIIQAEFTGETPEPEPEEKKKSKWIYYMRPAYIRI